MLWDMIKMYICFVLQVKLAQHTYSNLFGTFLCNSTANRANLSVHQRTFSVWSFLQTSEYYNHLYSSSQDQVSCTSLSTNVVAVLLSKELVLAYCIYPFNILCKILSFDNRINYTLENMFVIYEYSFLVCSLMENIYKQFYSFSFIFCGFHNLICTLL